MRLKLYHWHIDAYDYLIMSNDLIAARTILTDMLNSPGGNQARALGHIEKLRDQEPFVADPFYPIVIWH